MARAGAILAATLDLLAEQDPPGREHRRARRSSPSASSARTAATPTFKGYRGFPGSICASPNAMVVHGIPGPYRLKRGDIISIDVGVTLDGWVADAARTFPVGEVDAPQAQNLLSATEQSLHAGVAQCRAGNRMGDVSSAIQRVAEGAGLAVVRSLVGHGVGRSMHEDPQVPNYGKPGKGPLLEEGMVLAIEPMTTAGRPGGARGRRRLGDLLPGRLAGGALRVHRRDHRRGAARSSRRGISPTPASVPGAPASSLAVAGDAARARG